MKLIVATKNEGKMRDFKVLFSSYGFEVVSLNDLGFKGDIEEDGTTFEENALIKARAVSKMYNEAVVADDSGLEVYSLNNEPGIYSARYAGEEKDDEKNIDYLLENLKEYHKVEERRARFVSAIAVVFPDGNEFTVLGTCEGHITKYRKGTNGFGYDPVFYVNEAHKNMAELTVEEKQLYSHRADAFNKLKKSLKKF